MRLLLLFTALLTASIGQSQFLTDSLLLHWDFDNTLEDVSDNDFEGTGFEITFTEDRFGQPNSAAYFNGVDSYIEFPNVDELKPELPVSFTFWIKYDGTEYYDRAVFNTSFEEDRNTGTMLTSQASTGKYAIGYADGAYSYTSTSIRSYISNAVIDTSQWHHVALVYTSAMDMKIYIDCVEPGGFYSGSGDDLVYSITPGNLGRHDQFVGQPAYYFKGKIDDFRYWHREVTEEEILSMCPGGGLCDNDSIPPVFLSQPMDTTIDCNDEIPDAEEVLAEDNMGVVTIVLEEAVETEGCTTTITRTWTATDECENSSSITQVITVVDTEAPTIIGLPADTTVCAPYEPEIPVVQVIDNCDSLPIWESEIIFGGDPMDATSDLAQPMDPIGGEDWGITLNWGNEPGNFETHALVEGSIEYTDDGGYSGAILTGSVVSNSNPAAGWNFELTLESGMTWEEWSSQSFPTGYKDVYNVASEEYDNWMYYLLSESSAMTGWGDYDGSELQLSHYPVNNYYAFQEGVGANNVNVQNGIGGWFQFTGTHLGEEVSETGDIAVDLVAAINEVTYVWTASDCSGNEATFSQTVTIAECGPGLMALCPGDFDGDMLRNTRDLLELLIEMGCPNQCNCDLTGDDKTDVADILEFVSLFNVSCD